VGSRPGFDIAAVGAAALTGTEHEGRVYDLANPEALTYGEIAEKLPKRSTPVQNVNVPEEAMLEAVLGFGIPRWQADGLIEDYAHYRRGEAATTATGVQDATGAAPRSFNDFACDYASVFSQPT
jgi:uncharacterized protein YbjT (DUF2867 family)